MRRQVSRLRPSDGNEAATSRTANVAEWLLPLHSRSLKTTNQFSWSTSRKLLATTDLCWGFSSRWFRPAVA